MTSVEHFTIELPSLFTDQASHSSLATVLNWCDKSQSEMWFDTGIRDPSKKASDAPYVVRQVTLEMMVSGEEWTALVRAERKCRVRAWIVRVGRTSWVVGSSVETIKGVALARSKTVQVCVDVETLTKPVPVPGRETLEGLVKEDDLAGLETITCSKKPGDAFVWRTEVRVTDCDTLQHINNTVYGALMEAARWAAARAGVFKNSKGALGSVRKASIDYMGQPRAGDPLDIAVWWDKATEVVGFEFTVDQNIVATAALSLWGEPVIISSL
eukprot:gnl/MRDRNA2_/MRDRNA2_18568_c0_seq1.p1 gnl/MRDRNA2_/MRDRNA2_18568_c0~~gnl/MRDRNA2_/MRDRNA2_18568_c0_seq1.p1  ORF type:complete len:270 (+),score=36.78 gnl/MRDRNA2_/MRDRNA2_18568_c0_seq1:129-938(+)